MAKASGGMKEDRCHELRRMLEERRREVLGEVQERVRASRVEGALRVADKARDMGDDSEANMRDDIESTLTQMKADTLTRIDQALARLEDGSYGYCFDCGEEIAEKRLRALPFAVRCKECQEAQEAEEQRSRRHGFGLFADLGPQFDL